MNVLDLAINIVTRQTKAIRRFLRKNRNRLVYRVEGENLCRNVYSLKKAVRLAYKYAPAWIWQGEQNANWINSDNLTGIRWNHNRTHYMPTV